MMGEPDPRRALNALLGALEEINNAHGRVTASAWGSLLAARDLLLGDHRFGAPVFGQPEPTEETP